MLLCLKGHDFLYECENLCRLFFPGERIKTAPSLGESDGVLAEAKRDNAGYSFLVFVRYGGKTTSLERKAGELSEYGVTSLLYEALKNLTGISPPWGMLTGVHPLKLLRQYVEKLGDEEGLKQFEERCFVSGKKAKLAMMTLKNQRPYVEDIYRKDFCLYIGIPFCPSRCSYCSFVSESVARAGKLIEPYFDLLIEEIARTAMIAGNLGLRLKAVYVGGGTPTTLSASQLGVLCGEILKDFGPPKTGEFTVEAGRPDTITREKLEVLRQNGVKRISVNPQTLSDEVLKSIGRAHTAEDTVRAFRTARDVGFGEINCDLIAGLPNDTLEGFERSVQGVISLGAENVTVHSLALKRSANLSSIEGFTSEGETAANMVDYAVNTLFREGYIPYYLYRQSRTAGNLENTGWARPGTVCAYNIHSTDEQMSIISCGAGGVTKLIDPESGELTRIFNFKYPYEYISRFSEILERKREIERIFERGGAV